MDNSSGLQSRRPNNDDLAVNKISKTIRKSPTHHPFPTSLATGPRPPQPQVYNISKTDFRTIVQQLTGSSSPPAPPPPAVPVLAPSPPPPAANNSPKAASLRLQRIRPPPPSPIARPSIPNPPPPSFASGGGTVPITAESPVSAYMRYLQNSLAETGEPRPAAAPPFSGLPPTQAAPPSPTALFCAESPSSFLKLLSPRSPYPLLSLGFQFPPPLTPNFAFSAQSPGMLGLPPSPGMFFPLSPSGLFPAILSPRWRE